MKKLFAGAVTLLLGLCIAGCDTVRDHDKEEVTISVPHVIRFGNLTEVIIDPGEEECRIVYERYNRRGDSFHIPYETATVYSARQKYTISDKETGNGAIRINGKEYSLWKSNPVISIKCGIMWTSDKFEQDPTGSGTWFYPLKKELSEILKK